MKVAKGVSRSSKAVYSAINGKERVKELESF